MVISSSRGGESCHAVRGRNKVSSERWNSPAPITERELADAARQLEHRQKDIRAILANRGFESVFQPIVELGSGGVVGAEALTRFEVSPVRPPDVWFAEAREVGLGIELEMAALHSALGQLHRLPAGLYLSLNASPDAMTAPEFLDTVARSASERVVLELTEDEGIDDYELLETTVRALRSDGVRLALDGAGAAFSNLRDILQLRPDIIKLDVARTRGIEGASMRRALGSAMLSLGLGAYDVAIVAEGIETESEFQTLRGLGCRFGQGYYLGRPGRLRPPPPQPEPAEPLWLTINGEIPPAPVPGGVGVDRRARPRSTGGRRLASAPSRAQTRRAG